MKDMAEDYSHLTKAELEEFNDKYKTKFMHNTITPAEALEWEKVVDALDTIERVNRSWQTSRI